MWRLFERTLSRGGCAPEEIGLTETQEQAIREYKEQLNERYTTWRERLLDQNRSLSNENEHLRFQIEWISKQPVYKHLVELQVPKAHTAVEPFDV